MLPPVLCGPEQPRGGDGDRPGGWLIASTHGTSHTSRLARTIAFAERHHIVLCLPASADAALPGLTAKGVGPALEQAIDAAHRPAAHVQEL